MNALLHNPIADMYGPDFLLFYCSVIGITLVVCRELFWRYAQTHLPKGIKKHKEDA